MFGEMFLLLLLAAIARQRHFQFGTERDAVRIKQGIFRFQRLELAEKGDVTVLYLNERRAVSFGVVIVKPLFEFVYRIMHGFLLVIVLHGVGHVE